MGFCSFSLATAPPLDKKLLHTDFLLLKEDLGLLGTILVVAQAMAPMVSGYQ